MSSAPAYVRTPAQAALASSSPTVNRATSGRRHAAGPQRVGAGRSGGASRTSTRATRPAVADTASQATRQSTDAAAPAIGIPTTHAVGIPAIAQASVRGRSAGPVHSPGGGDRDRDQHADPDADNRLRDRQ